MQGEDARAKYVEAFRKSDLEAMLNYYQANYPRPPYEALESTPPIECPVLVMHGMKDKYLLAAGHAGTWDWVDGELTMVMFPEADHFLQHDEPERVTRTLVDWLATTRP
ncbi:MAG: alpha/beta hydrolase [Bryobacterales bacterium]